MKLAEALIERSNLQKELAVLQYRINENVRVQEGDIPAEDPNELSKTYIEKQGRLTYLIQKINYTNSNTKFDDAMTIADALAKRDGLESIKSHLSQMVEAASIANDRFTRSEVKFIRTIDIQSYQKKIDKISKDWRELDTKIQSLNWTVDLK